jgi:hypothetical protein
MNVLVRSGVIDEFRTQAPKDMGQPIAITDIANDGDELQLRVRAPELLFDLVYLVLAASKQVKLAHFESAQLAANLAPDRSTGSGHHHAPTRQLSSNSLLVELNRFPAQQVIRVNLPDLVEMDRSLDDLDEPGDNLERNTRVTTRRDHAPHKIPRAGRDSNNRFINRLSGNDLGQLVALAENRDAVDGLPLQRSVVIEKAHDLETTGLVQGNLAYNHSARFAGADYDDFL